MAVAYKVHPFLAGTATSAPLQPSHAAPMPSSRPASAQPFTTSAPPLHSHAAPMSTPAWAVLPAPIPSTWGVGSFPHDLLHPNQAPHLLQLPPPQSLPPPSAIKPSAPAPAPTAAHQPLPMFETVSWNDQNQPVLIPSAAISIRAGAGTGEQVPGGADDPDAAAIVALLPNRCD